MKQAQVKHKQVEHFENKYKTSLIIQIITRLMVPFIIMFGLSIIVHGHLTPGGGFQGGVVIGAGIILIGLAFNRDEGRRIAIMEMETVLISSGLIIYIIVGIVGMLLGYSFLTNRLLKFPPVGELGELFSGGTLFWINIGVGLIVSGIVIELFFAFLETKRDPEYYKNIKVLDKNRRWSDGTAKDDIKQN